MEWKKTTKNKLCHLHKNYYIIFSACMCVFLHENYSKPLGNCRHQCTMGSCIRIANAIDLFSFFLMFNFLINGRYTHYAHSTVFGDGSSSTKVQFQNWNRDFLAEFAAAEHLTQVEPTILAVTHRFVHAKKDCCSSNAHASVDQLSDFMESLQICEKPLPLESNHNKKI